MWRVNFTKLMVATYSIFVIVWVTWSYILASLGKEQIAEELSGNVVTVAIPLILGYFFKAYFETHSEEYNKLVRERWEHELKMAKLDEGLEEEEDGE